eukprot:8519188-Pyramimonas_sp.AAC.1
MPRVGGPQLAMVDADARAGNVASDVVAEHGFWQAQDAAGERLRPPATQPQLPILNTLVDDPESGHTSLER